jgi:hypothetical protein
MKNGSCVDLPIYYIFSINEVGGVMLTAVNKIEKASAPPEWRTSLVNEAGR